MNQFVPDCTTSNMGGDAFAAPPLGGGEDDGLMELLWCDGHVVMQSQQAPRKPPPRSGKEAEAAWFQYPAEEEDTLERDLFSELFGDPAGRAASKAEPPEEGKTVATTTQSELMPPPKKKASCVLEDDCAAAKTDAGGESSMLTIGSSFCGSNHVVRGGKGDAATATSSSMQPRNCAAKAGGAAHRSGKRKQRDAAETEDVEFESAAVTCEPAQKATTAAKRRRAAEVHNLSERRRRDRINEKMKALQELIPHSCNKTDKASMLDEAIEYLKTLQLQLQVMWMGGAAPVMFPTAAGVHHYVPRMPPFMAPPALRQSPPVADPYARCLAVDSLPGPMHCLQGTSFYQQQSPAPPPQPVVPGGSLPAATARTFPSDSTPHKQHENSSKTEIKEVSS